MAAPEARRSSKDLLLEELCLQMQRKFGTGPQIRARIRQEAAQLLPKPFIRPQVRSLSH